VELTCSTLRPASCDVDHTPLIQLFCYHEQTSDKTSVFKTEDWSYLNCSFRISRALNRNTVKYRCQWLAMESHLGYKRRDALFKWFTIPYCFRFIVKTKKSGADKLWSNSAWSSSASHRSSTWLKSQIPMSILNTQQRSESTISLSKQLSLSALSDNFMIFCHVTGKSLYHALSLTEMFKVQRSK